MQTPHILTGGSEKRISAGSNFTSRLQDNTRPKVASLLDRSLGVWRNFSESPSARTAIQIAEFYGYYPASTNIDMYPIMLFINGNKNAYVLYSDLVKQFWSINMDGKNHWTHSLETLIIYPETKTFSYKCFDYPTQLTYNIIGADFIKQLIIDPETETSLGNTFMLTGSIVTSGVPIEH